MITRKSQVRTDESNLKGGNGLVKGSSLLKVM